MANRSKEESNPKPAGAVTHGEGSVIKRRRQGRRWRQRPDRTGGGTQPLA